MDRGTRRARSENYQKKQAQIQKRSGLEVDSIHRFNKRAAMDCGNPECAMCGNRRALEGVTIQEKSFEQTEKWDESE